MVVPRGLRIAMVEQKKVVEWMVLTTVFWKRMVVRLNWDWRTEYWILSCSVIVGCVDACVDGMNDNDGTLLIVGSKDGNADIEGLCVGLIDGSVLMVGVIEGSKEGWMLVVGLGDPVGMEESDGFADGYSDTDG